MDGFGLNALLLLTVDFWLLDFSDLDFLGLDRN